MALLPFHGAIDGQASNLAPIVQPFPTWRIEEAEGLWCAAFVYYCCREAGFDIPYRPETCRSCHLAGCLGWEELALGDPQIEYHPASEGFAPEPGDLVLYDRVFENREHDHIGIVLEKRAQAILTSEGNVNNVSRVMERPIDAHIRAYIRLPDGYSYSAGREKIRFSGDPDINYVFHMLSVARCGYDNAYGEKYRDRYAPDDLQCIKEQETHLTVCGGSHCGDWYGPMVCAPARGGHSAKTYYTETIRWIEAGKLDLPEDTLSSIVGICRVMIRYYDDFMRNIWPAERRRIEDYIAKLKTAFAENDFTEKMEQAVGVSLPSPFVAALVSSIRGGAEAIDVSDTVDVFGIERSAEDELVFICHEYIVYLLKIALKEENTFQSLESWPLTEGLAEYYLQKVWPGARSFQSCQKQAEMYRELAGSCGSDAVALYRAASKQR